MAWPTIFGNLPAGNQPLSLFDTMFNLIANLVAIPCTAGGSANAITLTGSLANSPPVTAYQNFQPFKFKASATSTGLVSLQFAALASLPVYRRDGVTQCGPNDILAGFDYAVIFDQSRNGNTGGFYLEDSALGMQHGVSSFASIAAAATTDLGSLPQFFQFVTGTATITSLGLTPGIMRVVQFQSAGTTLVQSTTLQLPNNANNIVTNAGDTAIFASNLQATPVFVCLAYQRANGQALVSGGGGGFAGITPSVQFITASQTVSIPTGATKCKVTLVGGSGGSGGCVATSGGPCNPNNNATGGAGGPPGVLLKYLTALVAGNTLVLTIGGGGTAGTFNSSGGAGGDTTLVSGTQTITTLTASHGGGGAAAAGATGAIGASGTATNGDLNFAGGVGLNNVPGDVALGLGLSAKAPFSGGTNGVQGTGFGGAPSGGVDSAIVNRAGAAGLPGVAIFEWYP